MSLTRWGKADFSEGAEGLDAGDSLLLFCFGLVVSEVRSLFEGWLLANKKSKNE